MIHFLINNDYQYLEAERLAKELLEAGRSCSLIAIPHTLTRTIDEHLFSSVVQLATPAKHRWLQAWRCYLTIHAAVRSALPIRRGDTLFLFTEFELLNQLVAIEFKAHGGRVFLIEDGGVGTYIPLALKTPQPYTPKDRLYQWMVRRIPRLADTQFTKFDGINFPMLNDRHLDGVCLYRNMRINRRLPVTVIRRPGNAAITPTKGRAVFLNQPLYSEFIQTEVDYARGLHAVLGAMSRGFDEILFKFHPREPEEARQWISRRILSAYPKVRSVEKNQPFESMLDELRPEVVASYNSTPLLNLGGTGVQPLFIYHLLDDLRHAPSFDTMHALLESWGYQFAHSWNNVASGYHAGDAFDQPTHSQALAAFLATDTRAEGQT